MSGGLYRAPSESRRPSERRATSLPFLDLEPGHRCEVPHIVRYNGRFLRHGMRGDHQIEITDRLACALERCADARIVESHRIRPVEDCQAREVSLDELCELRPSGPFRPEAQLRRRDDRDT